MTRAPTPRKQSNTIRNTAIMGAPWARAHWRGGECQEALGALDKAVSLKPGDNSSDYFFLAMAHRQLGHADQARAWYDKGVQWMTQNRLKDEETRRFRAEAAELLGIPILNPQSKDTPVQKK